MTHRTDFATRDRLPASVGTPLLTIMVGPSRCGKTTTANRLATLGHRTVVFGMDDVRRCLGSQYNLAHEPMVRTVKCYAIGALLRRGYSVIADCTHLTAKSRKDTIDFISAMVDCKVNFAVIRHPDPEQEGEWQDACHRDDFPWEVVEYQMKRYEPVTEDEEHPVLMFPNRFDGSDP